MGKTLRYFFWLSSGVTTYSLLLNLESQKRQEIERRIAEVRHCIAKDLAVDSRWLNRMNPNTRLTDSALEELAFLRKWLCHEHPEFEWAALPGEDKQRTDIALPW